MMIRPLLAISVVFVLSLLAQPANADEKCVKWAKYFEGNWQRENKTWTADDGWKEESVGWTGDLVAGGTTLISRGTGNWGDFATVLGIEGHSGKFFEYGAAANGNKWRIVFETIESEKLVGKLMASTGDGTRGEGEIEIIRKGEDAYDYSWQLKLENGKQMKGSAKNKRKKP